MKGPGAADVQPLPQDHITCKALGLCQGGSCWVTQALGGDDSKRRGAGEASVALASTVYPALWVLQ